MLRCATHASAICALRAASSPPLGCPSPLAQELARKLEALTQRLNSYKAEKKKLVAEQSKQQGELEAYEQKLQAQERSSAEQLQDMQMQLGSKDVEMQVGCLGGKRQAASGATCHGPR
jgi:hypothetical protein